MKQTVITVEEYKEYIRTVGYGEAGDDLKANIAPAMTMIRRFLLVLVIVVGSNIALFAQNNEFKPFAVRTDTICLHVKSMLHPGSRYNLVRSAGDSKYYYLIFNEDFPYFGVYGFVQELDRKHLYRIPVNDTTVQEIPLIRDIQRANYYYDFYTVNDILHFKDYYDHSECARFDEKRLIWEKLNHLDDIIYEDEDFEIMLRDFGEWGRYIWLINKHNGREYIQGNSASDVVKFEGKYYLTKCLKIERIDNLSKFVLCDQSLSYENSESKYGLYRESLSNSNTVYWESERKPNFFFDDDVIYPYIVVSFVADGQLYHLYNDSTYLAIGQVIDGKLVEIQKICKSLKFFTWVNSYRGVQPDSHRMKQFEVNNNTYGILEINGKDIHIRYVIHDQDSIPYTRSDNLAELLEYVIKHNYEITVPQFDNFEKSVGATDVQLHSSSLNNYYFPKEYLNNNYPKKYYVSHDAHVSETTEMLYDSLEKTRSIFIEWEKTHLYTPNYHFDLSDASDKQLDSLLTDRTTSYKNLISNIDGMNLVTDTTEGNTRKIQWKHSSGMNIELYFNYTIRMEIDLPKE